MKKLMIGICLAFMMLLNTAEAALGSLQPGNYGAVYEDGTSATITAFGDGTILVVHSDRPAMIYFENTPGVYYAGNGESIAFGDNGYTGQADQSQADGVNSGVYH